MFIDPSSLASDREDAVPYTPQRLPSAQSVTLPSAPPSARPARPHVNMFDHDHWRDSLFAIGTGLLSGGNDFGASMAGAARNLQQTRQGYLDEMAPGKHELGGPDNAFDIVTNPRTGERTITPIAQFQDYQSGKRQAEQHDRNSPKPQERLAIRGSITGAILRLPPEQRASAYAQLRADTVGLGYGDMGLPETWEDHIGQAYADAAVDQEHRLAADTADARLKFDREKFGKEFPIRAATAANTIATSQARLGLARNADARAAAKSRLPKAPKGKGPALPGGFVLD